MSHPATATDLVSAVRARDRKAINHVAARLLDQGASLGEQWLDVAQVLVSNGEVALALSAAECGVEQSRRSAKAVFGQAQVLAAVGRQHRVLAIVSELRPAQLPPGQRDHFLGTCALEAGNLDLAKEAFERVVDVLPASGPSWLSLAALPASDDPTLLDRLNGASSAMNGAPADYRAQWHYAKGTVLDRLDQAQEAFAEFAAGAEIVRPTQPYDGDADSREAEHVAEAYTAAAIGRIAQQVSVDTGRPIFVTGLPRSGTTLVEQMLSRHSNIAGGGELTFAQILTREVGGSSLSQLQAFVSEHGADVLARLYLHLGDERFGEGRQFIDKSLANTRNLGLLASVLPQARVIWVRRDPLDCAWSCFRTFFSQRIPWSWSLADIAAHFRAEDRLYDHWRDVLGDRMLTLPYEELVAEPASHIERMLAHLVLAPEPGLEAVDRSDRAVTTASVIQVRQPIYRTAVGAAGPYRDKLQPFIEAYAGSVSTG